MNNQSKLGETHKDDCQPSKRQKLDEDDAQMIETTKIIDLNDDCLVEIFKRLSLRVLINVAVSNGSFVEAARSVYKKKFGMKCVDISCVRANPRPLDRHYSDTFTHINNYHILIEDLKTCLQFVRCFGPSINEMKICYNERTATTIKWHEYVDEYVNKYCANTLVNISYFNKQTFSMKNFQNPFIKVESVRIHRSNLGRYFPSFAEWFPNLRRLELLGIRIDRRFTRASFQHLEHFGTWIWREPEREFHFSNQNIAELLGMHPQLQILGIHSLAKGITFAELMDIIKGNHSIKKLELLLFLVQRASATELIQFANEHPALVELDFQLFGISADDAIALVGQLNSLKKFGFQLEDRDDTLDYLMEHLGNEWLQSSFLSHVELKRKD